MWNHRWNYKKVILLASLVIVVLIGCVTGVALAQGGNANGAQPGNDTALLEKVCTIYQANTGVTLDADQLQAAYAQARAEMKPAGNESLPQGMPDLGNMTQKMESQLPEMVSAGTITQEQADEYLQWWQSKPDIQLDMGGMMEGRGFGSSQLPADTSSGNTTSPIGGHGFGGGQPPAGTSSGNTNGS